jgi:VacB/RNase II family 3'-5' exoribonuclease
MVTHPDARRKNVLEQIARRAMQAYGFLSDFSIDVLREVETVQKVDGAKDSSGVDLRHLLWASIDNDDSLDLDQLTVAEVLTDTQMKVLVAVADVAALVQKNSAIDAHARQNTTSVYTAGRIFPMLPEKLSTDLTSLNYHEDRPAMIIEMVIGDGGVMQSSKIYRARVRNQAKLAYNSVAAWLEGNGPMPAAVATVPGLAENLRLQDRVAQQLKALRQEHGALDLQTLEARPVFAGDEIQDLQADERNRAKEIIEDFMIAANGVTARFLYGKKVASLRRIPNRRFPDLITQRHATISNKVINPRPSFNPLVSIEGRLKGVKESRWNRNTACGNRSALWFSRA